MSRRALLAAALAAAALLAGPLPVGAQAAPGDSVRPPRYRRPSPPGPDPMRHLMDGRSLLVLDVRASAGNNALDLADLGAILFLSERDSLLVSDVMAGLGLVPAGDGLFGLGEGEAGLALALRVGESLSLGVSARGAAYGSLLLDEDIVALLRDGNGARSDFSLGRSRGAALATAEAGFHALHRTSPGPGLRLWLGAGVRLLRPLHFARVRSLLSNGGTLRVTGDSVSAQLAVASGVATELFPPGGGGLAADLLGRLEIPERRVAFELAVSNLGAVSVPGVEIRRADVEVATTRLDSVVDVAESLSFDVADTARVRTSLPGLLRYSVTAWPSEAIQLDGALTLSFGDDFPAPPPSLHLSATWSPARTVALRAALEHGGGRDPGLLLGVAAEHGRALVRIEGEMRGGAFRGASGLGGRFALGLEL